MRSLIVLVITWLVAASAAAGTPEIFRDPEDGKLDLSNWLLERHGWLPVPVFITDPALGYGLGVALASFHRHEGTGPDGRPIPPSITGVGGLYTETHTWGAAAGHLGIWKRDTIRYRGGIGYADANLEFYLDNRPLDYNLRGGFLMQSLEFRVGGSGFFVGPRYVLFRSSARFADPVGIPGVDPNHDFANGGLAVDTSFDNRDNMLSPTKGNNLGLGLTRYDKAFGGDYDYWQLDADLRTYHHLSSEWFLNVRFDGAATDGDVPFYALPYIVLRGVPSLRYQGQDAASVETEVRWQLVPRWSVLAFAGLGRTWRGDTRLGQNETAVSGGAGFRYLIARELGLRGGIDIARGPEEWVFYIQMGHAWGGR
jgi:hypothetical protein